MMAPRFLPVVIAPQPPTEWKRTATAPSGSSEGVSSRLHLVGVIDAEHDERTPSAARLAVLARALADRELVGADRVLGAEVARAEAVDAAKEPRHLLQRDRGKPGLALQRLVQRGADVAPHRVVARHRFVGPLEDDDVLLARRAP